MLDRRRDASIVGPEPDGEDTDFGDMLLLVLACEELLSTLNYSLGHSEYEIISPVQRRV